MEPIILQHQTCYDSNTTTPRRPHTYLLQCICWNLKSWGANCFYLNVLRYWEKQIWGHMVTGSNVHSCGVLIKHKLLPGRHTCDCPPHWVQVCLLSVWISPWCIDKHTYLLRDLSPHNDVWLTHSSVCTVWRIIELIVKALFIQNVMSMQSTIAFIFHGNNVFHHPIYKYILCQCLKKKHINITCITD